MFTIIRDLQRNAEKKSRIYLFLEILFNLPVYILQSNVIKITWTKSLWERKVIYKIQV